MARLPVEQTASSVDATVLRRAAVIGAVIVCGLARLWYLTSSKVQFNADEATTGIMARQITHGHLYVFYAGQGYGGTLETYLQAAMYLVLRLPQDPLTLRLPLVALSMATCLLVYLVGLRVLPTSGHAVIAALLYAATPWFNVIGTSTSLGFYVASQFTATAALYCVLRVTADPPSRRVRWAFAAGLLSGLALWSVIATLYFLVPAALWLIPTVRRSARVAAAAAGGLILGALPMLGWLAVHRQLPLPPPPSQSSSIPERLGNLFGPVLREFVGVTYAHAEGGLPLAVQIVAVVGLLAAYCFAVWQRRRGLRSLVLLREDGRTPADLLLAVPVVVVVAYAASDSAWYTGTPRYLLITYPLFAIALAALIPRVAAVSAVRLTAVGTVLVVALSLLSWGSFRGLVTDPVDRPARAGARRGRRSTQRRGRALGLRRLLDGDGTAVRRRRPAAGRGVRRREAVRGDPACGCREPIAGVRQQHARRFGRPGGHRAAHPSHRLRHDADRLRHDL